MRVLSVAAEIFPYVKVGGLGDVMAALPKALRRLGVDCRVLVPGYPDLVDGLKGLEPVRGFDDLMHAGPGRLLLGEAEGGVPLYLLDLPGLYGNDGGPYGHWDQAHRRFAALSWAAAALAREGDGRGWSADLLHAHDWPAGLAPAYLRFAGEPRPRTLMTIHNIAYQGNFSPSVLGEVWLPPDAYAVDGAEFMGRLSFLKAGLYYADRLSTVSPTYAWEVQQPGGGRGLEGLLELRSHEFAGILNGIDTEVWNPAADPHLLMGFDRDSLDRRILDTAALRMELGLEEHPVAPLFGVVSRMEAIKGLDLVLPNLEHLVELGAQFALLGSGDPSLERAFLRAAERHPGRVAVRIGYNEGLAHRLYAGCDVLLVPSRSEPCGLTQMYAFRYGCLPLVRRTGGLADTVVDAEDHDGNGFLFGPEDAWDLGQAIDRACAVFKGNQAWWQEMQLRGMALDHGWDASARRYIGLFEDMLRRD